MTTTIYGEINYSKPLSNDFIWFQSAGTGVTTTENGAHYLVMQNAANYTVVNYTEDATEPEFSVEGANKAIFGDNGDGERTFVFARVIDEKLVDVVVYITK